jgi:hypothetical protein
MNLRVFIGAQVNILTGGGTTISADRLVDLSLSPIQGSPVLTLVI